MRFIPIGRVLSPHGLRGEVKFKYFNEAYEDFSSYTSFFTKVDGDYIELKPLRTQFRNGLFHIIFEGFEDVEKVKFLVNRELEVRESDLPALPEGIYYHYQLIGLEVLDSAGSTVGTVVGVYHTKGGDILGVVKEGTETLITLSDDQIEEVDLKALVIRLTASPAIP
jgi:16S rRNA processing protein RimM